MREVKHLACHPIGQQDLPQSPKVTSKNGYKSQFKNVMKGGVNASTTRFAEPDLFC